ncbi:E4 [Francolinus leucoscepus papillomavirus 1]|uniref:E4 n=1 Tax=Francolinus leucoscepus papillomavirus 1 TaxID=485362 RepID=C6ZDA3_9PAPI|nr:E4 [Francolinus leucoscepus papillomavirus 1]ABX61089.1 E4 [Francolinus leucoscepus papillomavirus 1]
MTTLPSSGSRGPVGRMRRGCGIGKKVTDTHTTILSGRTRQIGIVGAVRRLGGFWQGGGDSVLPQLQDTLTRPPHQTRPRRPSDPALRHPLPEAVRHVRGLGLRVVSEAFGRPTSVDARQPSVDGVVHGCSS